MPTGPTGEGIYPTWYRPSTSSTGSTGSSITAPAPAWNVSTNAIWVSWVTSDSGTDTTATSAPADPWYPWVAANTLTTHREHQRYESWLQRVEALMTPEERAEQERKRKEREELRRVEREEKMKAREAAIFRAERLLRSCLTAEQEAMLDKHRYFEIKGGKTGTKYRIKRGRHINIEVLGRNGKPERKLCFAPAPRIDCPDADAMLSQKLMLELDEDAALKVAFKHGIDIQVQHGRGDAVVPRARREEILAEVVPRHRACRAA